MIPGLPKLCLEAGRTIGWADFAGPDSHAVGIDTFGKSAPASKAYAALGLTAEKVAEAARKMVK